MNDSITNNGGTFGQQPFNYFLYSPIKNDNLFNKTSIEMNIKEYDKKYQSMSSNTPTTTYNGVFFQENKNNNNNRQLAQEIPNLYYQQFDIRQPNQPNQLEQQMDIPSPININQLVFQHQPQFQLKTQNTPINKFNIPNNISPDVTFPSSSSSFSQNKSSIYYPHSNIGPTNQRVSNVWTSPDNSNNLFNLFKKESTESSYINQNSSNSLSKNNLNNSTDIQKPSYLPPTTSTTTPSSVNNKSNNNSTTFSNNDIPIPTSTTTTTTTTTSSNQQNVKIPINERTINQLLFDLYDHEKREESLSEIVKRKESIPNLHLYIYHTPMIMTILLQEVLNIYRYILPQNQKLKARASNRVCNTLALFQIVASNLETRQLFIKSRYIVYLFPFLKTISRTKPFEYLRLSTLNVISALIKVEIKDVIKLLLDSDVTSSCLKIMENCSELSKTVSTFILQKILNEDEGLNYFCTSPTRLQSIFHSLNSMIDAMLPDHMSSRLLKHIIRCYLRLSDNLKAREILSKSVMPECFSNGQLNDFLNQEGDMIVKRWYHQLMANVFPQQHQQGRRPYHSKKFFGPPHHQHYSNNNQNQKKH